MFTWRQAWLERVGSIGCLLRAPMSYDQIAETYDCLHEDLESRREGQAIADVLGSFVRNSQKVLDLGCGTGLLLELLDVNPEAGWPLFVLGVWKRWKIYQRLL